MKSARSKSFFLPGITFVLFLFMGGILHAAQDTGTLSQQLDEIKAQLADLQQQNKNIQTKQDEILEDLAQLRIWVHRK